MWSYWAAIPIIFFAVGIIFPINLNLPVLSILCTILLIFKMTWHEFGHAVMVIHEHLGIVRLYISFTRKGLSVNPSIAHFNNNYIGTSNKRAILMGGVVATVIFNPIINLILLLLLEIFLPINFLLILILSIAIPFSYFFNSLMHNSSDIKKLEYSYGHAGCKHIIKDISHASLTIINYCIGRNKYLSTELLSDLIPEKKYGEKTVTNSFYDNIAFVENNKLEKNHLEKKEEIWRSINDSMTIKEIVDIYGIGSILTLAQLRDEDRIAIVRK